MRIAVSIALPLVVLAAQVAGTRGAVAAPNHQVFVYWDQNEEEDMLIDGQVKQLVLPWDTNGQMCIFPDHSGRFTVGYNPTLPSQDNPGGACPGGGGACLKPLHNPPVGEAIWDRHGNSTPDQTISVPGPYALPGSSSGGDIPPQNGGPWQSGAYNNDGSYTGCAFDRHGHFFAVDIGTAQGQVPVPDSGRLIEWFPPDYTSYCIIYGPDTGGTGPHHVDGAGGLRDPGTLAVYREDVYVPETGAGRVLRFRHQLLPRSAAVCGPDGVLTPRPPLEVFIQDPSLGLPAGIARDPTAHGWAVSNILGNPAVAWFTDAGAPNPGKGPLPAGAYNPYGLAVTRDGDLYFVDTHITCDASGCGPGNNTGGVFKVTFSHGVPSVPQTIATGLNFPVSVTLCRGHDCPTPP
jgi:hypothetical protein